MRHQDGFIVAQPGVPVRQLPIKTFPQRDEVSIDNAV